MTNEKQRILIVDDEPQITRVLRRSLTSHSYDVRVASDGLIALQTFGDWPPDLVVTDLSMPKRLGDQSVFGRGARRDRPDRAAERTGR